MCIICTDLIKEKLSSIEARRNLGEMHTTAPKEHILEILKLIWKKEDQEAAEKEKAIDQIFHGPAD